MLKEKRALTDRERQLEQEALDEQDRLLRTGNKKHVGILGLSYSDDEDGANNNNENDDDDDDDEIIYNPLKLPLGWDGKPIPFWLWKLNGLGIEYPCQICGNYVYKGRKEFEKHFTGGAPHSRPKVSGNSTQRFVKRYHRDQGCTEIMGESETRT